MTYANSDNYLLLKQLLVALKLKHLGSIVEVGNVEITKDGALTDRICELIYTMEADFTLPYALLRDMPIHLDLSIIEGKLSLLVNKLSEEGLRQEHLVDVEDPEALYRLIFDCPNIEGFGSDIKENINNKNFYSNTRKLSARLVESTANALTRIRKWAERSDDDLPLAQVLILLNCVEVVDWVFAFTNDYYGVPENDLKREQPEQ